MSYYFLSHSRTPGSKNGVRLYQNEDGTWTTLGLERRREEYRQATKGSVGRNIARGTVAVTGIAASTAAGAATGITSYNSPDKAFAPGKDGKPSKAEKGARATNEMVKATKDMTDAIAKNGKKQKPYLNDLSNSELEKMIRRMDLEKRYTDLSTGDAEKGGDWVNTSLAVAGGLSAVGLSVAAVLSAIKAFAS